MRRKIFLKYGFTSYLKFFFIQFKKKGKEIVRIFFITKISHFSVKLISIDRIEKKPAMMILKKGSLIY